jgi:Protein of unknown function (DUF2946)
MGSVRRHRRLFGVLAILALVANVVAGALCHMPKRAATLVDDILGPLSLCTSDGSGTIQHDGSAPDQSRKTHGSCTICTLFKAFAVAVALAFGTIVFPLFGAPVPQSAGVRTLAQHLSLGAIRSRAPPLPA